MILGQPSRAPRLSPQERDALNRGLSELLSALKVDDGAVLLENWPAVSKFANLLKRSEHWRSQLSAFDVFSIVRLLVQSALPQADPKPHGLLPKIMTAAGFADAQKAVRDFLLSLPRQYQLWIELPSMVNWEGAREVSAPDRDRSHRPIRVRTSRLDHSPRHSGPYATTRGTDDTARGWLLVRRGLHHPLLPS